MKNRVYKDYKSTGQCRFSLGQVNTGYGFMAVILKKNGLFTPFVNIG
jgi:hypothetical protein